jgi:hypothetical protein
MLLEAMLFFALGAPADPDAPPSLSDLRRFPGRDECAEQLARYRAHREQLQERRWLHGYVDGRLDAWLVETDRCIRAWWLLERARACEFGHDEEWNRGHLSRLRELIGEDAYRRGWHPPLLPEPPTVPAPPLVKSNQAM